MNEFLQHLRATSNDRRRNNKNYKNIDGNIGNHHPERRSGSDRRLRAHKPSGITEETITSLKQSIQDIHTSIQDQILVFEKNTDAQERQAEALEHIADLFAAFMERVEEVPPPEQEAAPKEAQIVDENMMMSAEEAEQIKKTSRTYILNLIQSLRDKNATYDEVALYLTENNFPTFSGRGRWHAQTIHRLCQEIKKAKAKKQRK